MKADFRNFLICPNYSIILIMRKWLRTSGNYLKWHYGKALFSTFFFWENIFLFIFNYFSIKNLIHHFFTPYRQLSDSNHFKNFLRILLGMLARSVALIVGISACIIYILLLPLSLAIWFLLPILVIWFIIYGLILIFFA